jgi:hypothetical protein
MRIAFLLGVQRSEMRVQFAVHPGEGLSLRGLLPFAEAALSFAD